MGGALSKPRAVIHGGTKALDMPLVLAPLLCTTGSCRGCSMFIVAAAVSLLVVLCPTLELIVTLEGFLNPPVRKPSSAAPLLWLC